MGAEVEASPAVVGGGVGRCGVLVGSAVAPCLPGRSGDRRARNKHSKQMTTHKRLLTIHGLKGRMHERAPSVRENRQRVIELSQCVPTINKDEWELPSVWRARHSMLRHAIDADRRAP